MNRTCALALGSLLLLASPAFSQETTTPPPAITDASGVPTVEAQMKLLTARLALTDDQKVRIQAVLETLHAATEQAVHDESGSPQERFDRVSSARIAADKGMRGILTDDQQKDLDQLEQEPHPELHGAITSAASLAPQP
jgi:hypothetical protein